VSPCSRTEAMVTGGEFVWWRLMIQNVPSSARVAAGDFGFLTLSQVFVGHAIGVQPHGLGIEDGSGPICLCLSTPRAMAISRVT
jgi:hypothetical protein